VSCKFSLAELYNSNKGIWQNNESKRLAFVGKRRALIVRLMVCSALAFAVPGDYSNLQYQARIFEPMKKNAIVLVASHAQEQNNYHGKPSRRNNDLVKPWALQALISSKVLMSKPSLESLVQEKATQFYNRSDVAFEEYLFVIDKQLQSASVYKLKLEKIESSKVSTGFNYGEKLRQGDRKTPSGVFKVESVANSSSWIYNSETGSYGNYFARLSAGSWDSLGKHYPGRQSSIGIHGTNRPQLLGTRASDGCIRLSNDTNNYYVASGILKRGTVVAILPDRRSDAR
jgi:lipoprotein-anchoring transpeptidase ErfK/SrfK